MYIPLSKGLCTDVGNELTSLALQVHGGMGFVEETGRRAALPRHPHRRHLRGHQRDPGGRPRRAQVVDASRWGRVRAARRVRRRRRPAVRSARACDTSARTCTSRSAPRGSATEHLVERATTDPNAPLSASTPYLRLLGTVVCAGLLARSALAAATAAERRSVDGDEAAFRHAKLVSARFFGEQILPTAVGLLGAITAGSADLFALTPDHRLTQRCARIRTVRFVAPPSARQFVLSEFRARVASGGRVTLRKVDTTRIRIDAPGVD